MKKIAVMISGGGSNMKSLHKACLNGTIDAEISVIISNNPNAGGLVYAKKWNIPYFVVDHKKIKTRTEFDSIVGDILSWFTLDYVCLAGFMRILGCELVEVYEGRMINIHPSLLPKYPGLDTYQRALSAGDKQYGATVHFVIPELDAGPIIKQLVLDIHDNDTVDSMKERLSFREPDLYVRSMRELCEATPL